MIGKKLLATLGVVVFAAGLMGVPAQAKCPGKCKKQIVKALNTCKKGCPKKKAGKACRMTCVAAKAHSTASCKGATMPTPPACSASAAFLDDLAAF